MNFLLRTTNGLYLPHQLIPKGVPRKLGWIPLYFITMYAIVDSNKLLSHGHEECIKYIKSWTILIIDRHESTVKAPTKLDDVSTVPSRIQLFSGTLESFGGLQGIACSIFLYHCFPRFPEGLKEFLRRDRNLINGENGSFAGNGIIVLVNQFLLINGLAVNIRFGEDFDALGKEGVANHFLSRRGVGVRLDEDECRVLERT